MAHEKVESSHLEGDRSSSMDKGPDATIQAIEVVTASSIQLQFPTLYDLSMEQTESLERQLVRKLDWRLMPTITIMFLMNYLDRINVSNAHLAGLQEDLNMSDTGWNAGISTFYVGYLIGQLNGNL